MRTPQLIFTPGVADAVHARRPPTARRCDREVVGGDRRQSEERVTGRRSCRQLQAISRRIRAPWPACRSRDLVRMRAIGGRLEGFMLTRSSSAERKPSCSASRRRGSVALPKPRGPVRVMRAQRTVVICGRSAWSRAMRTGRGGATKGLVCDVRQPASRERVAMAGHRRSAPRDRVVGADGLSDRAIVAVLGIAGDERGVAAIATTWKGRRRRSVVEPMKGRTGDRKIASGRVEVWLRKRLGKAHRVRVATWIRHRHRLYDGWAIVPGSDEDPIGPGPPARPATRQFRF